MLAGKGFGNEEGVDLKAVYGENAFARLDESDDREFYARDRFVEHLDSLALSTVEKLIGEFVVEEEPVILDLMAGWNSHIPSLIHSSRVVGLGLNENELTGNKAVTETVIHDVNADTRLPFEEGEFDVVLNTASVDYMTNPLEIFGEVGRILKPGGLFLVIFSNRMFPQKATQMWRESGEEERIIFVEELFRHSGHFEPATVFVSKGQPRPPDDKYAHLGIPSDPVYAVYAEKKGGGASRRPRPQPFVEQAAPPDDEALRRRMRTVKESLRCPYCGERLKKWAIPQTPFTEWNREFMYVCFNDACPYLLRGWKVMDVQGNRGMSYRCMYNPDTDRCMPIPVPSIQALKEGILD
jgi:SAM-dependent methyltransferase